MLRIVYIYLIYSFDNVVTNFTFHLSCSISEIHYLETESLLQTGSVALKPESSTLKVTFLVYFAV
jgi:hypothetical protein